LRFIDHRVYRSNDVVEIKITSSLDAVYSSSINPVDLLTSGISNALLSKCTISMARRFKFEFD